MKKVAVGCAGVLLLCGAICTVLVRVLLIDSGSTSVWTAFYVFALLYTSALGLALTPPSCGRFVEQRSH